MAAKWTKAKNVIWEELDGGALLIDATTGARWALNATAAALCVVNANTYTKYYLAFFDQYDWEHVPAIPPEMMLLPKLSPIQIYDMSSWSRTIFVPLSIIYALKPVCIVPPECQIDEL